VFLTFDGYLERNSLYIVRCVDLIYLSSSFSSFLKDIDKKVVNPEIC